MPAGVATVLSVLRSSALVVDDERRGAEGLRAGATRSGWCAGSGWSSDELADLVRQVRRDGQIRETELADAAARAARRGTSPRGSRR